MTLELPSWWPPLWPHEVTAAETLELFAYPRTIIRPVMADARRRIRERVGLDASILADRAATITTNKLIHSGSYAEGGTYQMVYMSEVSPACGVRSAGSARIDPT